MTQEAAQTVTQVLVAGVAQLRAAGVDDPGRDGRLLMAAALGVAADRLTLHMQDPFPASARPVWVAHVAARAARQPVAQILGRRAFFGRMFRVTPDVLDPRPDTETLIEAALSAPATRILDIGTGSGCILLTLLAEWTEAQGTGTDKSAAALGVAQENANRLDLSTRATFVETDWARDVAGPFDLIVSNPPYITGPEMQELAPEVRDWEPTMALTPGPEGLESYRLLVPQAMARLRPGGRLLLEIGAEQGADVAEICRAAGFENVSVLADINGRDRVVRGQTPE